MDCPTNGECLVESIVYEAIVKDDTGGVNNSIGLTEGTFKDRYTAHKSSFNLPHKATSTTLSGHIWNLKNSNTSYTISWKIICSAASYNPISGRCILCLKEKQAILYRGSSLNSRSEIASSCRHKKKYSLQKA